MAALPTTFRDLALGGQYPIHRADQAKMDAFIEQCRVDFGRGLIGKTRGAQMGKNLITLAFRQGAR